MSNSSNTNSTSTTERGVWSTQEHDKFLDALKIYPEGPWRAIADFVGSRSARQVQTHAQKYYEKVARRVRGLRKDRKRVVRAEHRLDDDMATLCREVEGDEDAVVTAMASSTRRGLQTIALRQHGVSSPSRNSEAKDASIEQDGELDLDEMASLSEEENGGESDLSLSSLDDDYLSYLMQILESQDFATEARTP
ncbi:hypothetical protein Gpo141_00000404 [Globisporangium polare]